MQARLIDMCAQNLKIPLRIAWVFTLLVVSILAATSLFNAVHAADIARDVRAGREDETLQYDGYLEISASAILNEIPIPGADPVIGTIGIGGHLRYRRFFLDAYAESFNRFQFGLNAYSGDILSIDLLSASSEHGVDSELNTELKLFSDRDPALLLGGRATGYIGDYLFQFEALSDVSNVHNGSLITASVAKTWLRHNWNFHALLGARYESGSSLDYQFGNNIEDASEDFPAYTAGSGTTIVTEFGVTYPINQYFIFNATGRWWELPSAIERSPFITHDSFVSFSTSITFIY